MASAEHKPMVGIWGWSPQRGPGAEPLVSLNLKTSHDYDHAHYGTVFNPNAKASHGEL